VAAEKTISVLMQVIHQVSIETILCDDVDWSLKEKWTKRKRKIGSSVNKTGLILSEPCKMSKSRRLKFYSTLHLTPLVKTPHTIKTHKPRRLHPRDCLFIFVICVFVHFHLIWCTLPED